MLTRAGLGAGDLLRICLSSTWGSSLRVWGWGPTNSPSLFLFLHLVPPLLSCAVLRGRGRCPLLWHAWQPTAQGQTRTQGQSTVCENPAPRTSVPGCHTPVWGASRRTGGPSHVLPHPTHQAPCFTSSSSMFLFQNPGLANSPRTAAERLELTAGTRAAPPLLSQPRRPPWEAQALTWTESGC